MVFGIYRDRMIRIIKRSLCEVTHCKKWFKIFIWENFFVSLEKQKLLKPEFMRDTSEFDWLREMYLIDILKTYIECIEIWNVLKFFDVVYIGAELMKPCLAGRAKNVVLFCFYVSTTAIAEDFSYSQCKIQVAVGLISIKRKFEATSRKIINKTN